MYHTLLKDAKGHQLSIRDEKVGASRLDAVRLFHPFRIQLNDRSSYITNDGYCGEFRDETFAGSSAQRADQLLRHNQAEVDLRPHQKWLEHCQHTGGSASYICQCAPKYYRAIWMQEPFL